MKIISKKSLLITVLIFLSCLNLYSESLSFKQGLSPANISYVMAGSGSYGKIDFFKYRVLEETSGLGFSVYLAKMGITGNLTEVFNDYESYLDFELNWEPFYKHETPYGFGAFYSVGDYLPNPNIIDHRFGLRADLRLPFFFYESDFIYNPLIILDTGYSIEKGFFIELKADLLIEVYLILI